MKTTARLNLGFVTTLVLFAIASLVTLHAMGEMARSDQAVATAERSKHAADRVAALVREQYIHQAHTIIEGNRSHLDHYNDIAERTRVASDDLIAVTRTAEQRAIAEEVASLVRTNHTDFLATTLPAVDRGDNEEVLRLHLEMERVVGRATTLIGELNEQLEAESAAARRDAIRAQARARTTTILCFVIAAAFATLVVTITTRSVARRMARVREGTRQIGEGRLEHRIALPGNDELADVARSVDGMAARLGSHQRELLRAQKLASIGRLSASVAHEINGPLGIILGYASILRSRGADGEALDAIEDEARHAQGIVQGLLELSRNQAPLPAEVDLTQLAHDVVGRLAAAGKVDRDRVRLSVAACTARCDEHKLRRVLVSLILNAADATRDEGEIRITTETRGDRAVLSVADDGPGFDADAMAHLFEPFFTTKASGTGLGLVLAQSIVEAHCGELRVQSPPTGARVEVDLPRSAA